MAVRGIKGAGQIKRSPHTRRARNAVADKLAGLRGKERQALGPKGSSFADAVTVAARFSEKAKPKGKGK